MCTGRWVYVFGFCLQGASSKEWLRFESAMASVSRALESGGGRWCGEVESRYPLEISPWDLLINSMEERKGDKAARPRPG